MIDRDCTVPILQPRQETEGNYILDSLVLPGLILTMLLLAAYVGRSSIKAIFGPTYSTGHGNITSPWLCEIVMKGSGNWSGVNSMPALDKACCTNAPLLSKFTFLSSVKGMPVMTIAGTLTPKAIPPPYDSALSRTPHPALKNTAPISRANVFASGSAPGYEIDREDLIPPASDSWMAAAWGYDNRRQENSARSFSVSNSAAATRSFDSSDALRPKYNSTNTPEATRKSAINGPHSSATDLWVRNLNASQTSRNNPITTKSPPASDRPSLVVMSDLNLSLIFINPRRRSKKGLHPVYGVLFGTLLFGFLLLIDWLFT